MNSQFLADLALNRSMALNLKPGLTTRLVLGYDIWCQYGVHLLKHFEKFGHLSFPAFLEELLGPVPVPYLDAFSRELLCVRASTNEP